MGQMENETKSEAMEMETKVISPDEAYKALCVLWPTVQKILRVRSGKKADLVVVLPTDRWEVSIGSDIEWGDHLDYWPVASIGDGYRAAGAGDVNSLVDVVDDSGSWVCGEHRLLMLRGQVYVVERVSDGSIHNAPVARVPSGKTYKQEGNKRGFWKFFFK